MEKCLMLGSSSSFYGIHRINVLFSYKMYFCWLIFSVEINFYVLFMKLSAYNKHVFKKCWKELEEGKYDMYSIFL